MEFGDLHKAYNCSHITLLEKLEGFTECQVIHEINNCFKHNDNKASKLLVELSHNSKVENKFEKGDKIQLTNDEILTYLSSTEIFCIAMINNKLKR